MGIIQCIHRYMAKGPSETIERKFLAFWRHRSPLTLPRPTTGHPEMGSPAAVSNRFQTPKITQNAWACGSVRATGSWYLRPKTQFPVTFWPNGNVHLSGPQKRWSKAHTFKGSNLRVAQWFPKQVVRPRSPLPAPPPGKWAFGGNAGDAPGWLLRPAGAESAGRLSPASTGDQAARYRRPHGGRVWYGWRSAKGTHIHLR